MIRPIILYDDPVLREKSSAVDKNSKIDLDKLIDDMFDTMHKAKGIGLSAIQIGIPLKIFVIEAHIEKENFHFREVFINPKIISYLGENVKHVEGCLSIPYLTGILERPDGIEIEWYDEKWNYHKEELFGIPSRIIQHEYDHLNGILYIDHLDIMWKEMFSTPLEMIKDNKIEVNYLCKKAPKE